MGTDTQHNNKPANPAPPLNALKKPEIKKTEPVKHRSVYDEIAERRKHEKHRIGVSSSEEREERQFRFSDEVKNNTDDDVKVYIPDKKSHTDISSESSEEKDAIPEYPRDIYSDDGVEYPADEENFDLETPPIPEPPKRIGLWVAVISALSALCVIAAGVYGAVNGYFDGLIKML